VAAAALAAAAMDLVMQVATQPHTHRVWRYFQERQQWHDVFPPNFAVDAEEVGPFTGTSALSITCRKPHVCAAAAHHQGVAYNSIKTVHCCMSVADAKDPATT
jgi:hypothetical protein